MVCLHLPHGEIEYHGLLYPAVHNPLVTRRFRNTQHSLVKRINDLFNGSA